MFFVMFLKCIELRPRFVHDTEEIAANQPNQYQELPRPRVRPVVNASDILWLLHHCANADECTFGRNNVIEIRRTQMVHLVAEYCLLTSK